MEYPKCICGKTLVKVWDDKIFYRPCENCLAKEYTKGYESSTKIYEKLLKTKASTLKAEYDKGYDACNKLHRNLTKADRFNRAYQIGREDGYNEGQIEKQKAEYDRGYKAGFEAGLKKRK